MYDSRYPQTFRRLLALIAKIRLGKNIFSTGNAVAYFNEAWQKKFYDIGNRSEKWSEYSDRDIRG